MKKSWLLVLMWSYLAFAKDVFIIPNRISQDVDFWAKVYREWDSHQVIFYDSKTKVVYDVLDLPVVNNEISSVRYKRDVDTRLKQITATLKHSVVDKKLEGSSELAGRIKGIVSTNGFSAADDLVERLRAQNGLRSRFMHGLKMSGRYVDDMKAILKAEELPEELLAIVFVESLFDLSVVSHAGASGPWGMVKETAVRSGIHVNNFTNETKDWVVATWGAAQFIKRVWQGVSERIKQTSNEASLGPLVITAYNYGYPGVMRAIANWGGDFETILENHQSPLFGYASKSYYAEVVAALDTLRNQEKYFPGLLKDERYLYDTVQVQRPLEVGDLLSLEVLKKEDLQRLNPSLTKRTLDGQEVIPANFVLRVPKRTAETFYKQIKRIDQKKRSLASNKISVKHRARPNETLLSIARHFGIFEDYLSKRMDKPLNYKPKGTVLIRSEAHKFFPLLELNQNILSTRSVGSTLEKP